MPNVALRFVTANDLISRAIRGGELGFWASHVECRMPDGTLLGAHVDGGVQARAGDYDATWSQQLFVDVPCNAAQAAAFYSFLASQIGKPYDLTAIGEMADGFTTGEAPDWVQSPAWICSALQMGALIASGIALAAPATVRLATPRDVLVACGMVAAIGIPEMRGA